ncbi:6864_t:CDS:2, partial [Racocetra persica]
SVNYLGWKTKKDENKSTNTLMIFYDLLKMENIESNKYIQETKVILMFGDGPGFVLVKAATKDHVVGSANTWKHVMLSEVEMEFPIRMSIKVRDLAITNHQADKQTIKEIKMKLLIPHN